MKTQELNLKLAKKDWDRLVNAHEKKLQVLYGPDTLSNIGWVTDDNSITSKIYTDPQQYLCSYLNGCHKIVHQWSLPYKKPQAKRVIK